MIESFSSILITGASSGIGAALARQYAGPGIRLVLHGRDADRLDAVAVSCRAQGADVEVTRFDVTDRAAAAAAILAADQRRPLDLVIANAGIGSSNPDSHDNTVALLDTNLGGVLNTLYPALDAMRPRGRGTIALMSSLAGFRGLPGSAAYCAGKAAVRVLGEGLRGEYLKHGIKISVIAPGYVVSPMTARHGGKLPLLMSAERAAGIIARGLARGTARIGFPRPMLWAAILGSVLSPNFADRWILRVPHKPD
jgi:NADP-dependent 3-hydroxy acid dehydrogenase YdfG